MKNLYFTPGPTQPYPTVKKHILKAMEQNIPSISHRGKQFQEMLIDAKNNLRDLLNIPENYRILLLSSGTEAMERIIESLVKNQSYHLVNGAFSDRWKKTAEDLEKKAFALHVENGESFDYEQIQIPQETEMICVTHNETSTGVMQNLSDIYSLKKNNSNALLAVDIVSSAPYVDLDYTKVDVAFFSVQKGFGLPAGLAVLIVSPDAIKKANQLSKVNPQTFHSLESLCKCDDKNETLETPNVLGIYLFGKVCQDMIKEGANNIRSTIDIKYRLLESFIDQSKDFQFFVTNKQYRSKTVIVLNAKDGSKRILEILRKKNIILGTGYKKMKDRQIRIANFPSTSSKEWQYMVAQFNNF